MQLDLLAHLFTHVGEDPLRELNSSHFESDISYYAETHHPATREWLFSEVNKWHQHIVTDRNRNIPNICLVTGNPGMGKSVVAAKLCTMGEEKRIWLGASSSSTTRPADALPNAGTDTCLPFELYIP